VTDSLLTTVRARKTDIVVIDHYLDTNDIVIVDTRLIVKVSHYLDVCPLIV